MLDVTAQALLDMCAREIVNRNHETDPDLDRLDDAFSRSVEEVVQTLADLVTLYSHGRYTIRRASSDLFQSRVKGFCLYLVMCPTDTPSDEVTQLDHDMMLVRLGPYSNPGGLVVNAQPRIES